ncbi:MAG: hypothetical protein ABIU20_00590 [Blastocatellia bacterium]
MIIILFISLFFIMAAAIALRLSTHQKTNPETSRQLPASQFDGLFAKRHAEEAKALVEEDVRLREDAKRQQLLARAAEGEITTLSDAHALNDAQFYTQVMQAVFTQADDNPKVLQSIAEHIVASQELRSSSEFAETMINLWSKLPEQYSLANMLYLAGIADDAAVFKRAINAALTLWRDGRIEKVSAKEFLAMVESAYWLIASEVRTSGSGFLLKQAIADVRRELAAANRRSA